MPALRTYIVTRVQVVKVSTAGGYDAALSLASHAFDGGDAERALMGTDLPGHALAPPTTKSIHLDRE